MPKILTVLDNLIEEMCCSCDDEEQDEVLIISDLLNPADFTNEDGEVNCEKLEKMLTEAKKIGNEELIEALEDTIDALCEEDD
jgi:hypothetical protein